MPEIVPSWEDSPSTATPLNAANLNQGSVAIRDLDTRLSLVEGQALPIVTKRPTLTFGSPNGTPLALGTNQATSRAINMIHSTPSRYRFKISNASGQNGSNPGTPITINTIWIGTPAYTDASHNNKWMGDLTVTPVQVYGGAGSLPASGTTDLVTPWITNGGEITAMRPFAISMGLTATSGGSGVTPTDCYGAIQYGASSASQAGIAAPGAGYNYSGFFFDVRMEYEFASAPDVLVVLVIGASGESGYSPTGDLSASPRALNDPLDAWPSVWAYRHGHHVINAGLFGSATTDWTNLSGRPYARLDLATTIPDAAIIGLMASNDISLGTTITTIISNYVTIIGNLRSLGVRRLFGTTVPPRGLSGSNETTRTAFNAFIRAVPDGLEDVFDADLALRDPGTRSAMISDLVSADNIHPLRGGYRVMASLPAIHA